MPGFEWNTEDVLAVLVAHGVCTYEGIASEPVQRAFDICIAHERCIAKAVLYYTDMDQQVDSLMDEIERILREHGIVSGEKRFHAPADEDV